MLPPIPPPPLFCWLAIKKNYHPSLAGPTTKNAFSVHSPLWVSSVLPCPFFFDPAGAVHSNNSAPFTAAAQTDPLKILYQNSFISVDGAGQFRYEILEYFQKIYATLHV